MACTPVIIVSVVMRKERWCELNVFVHQDSHINVSCPRGQYLKVEALGVSLSWAELNLVGLVWAGLSWNQLCHAG